MQICDVFFYISDGSLCFYLTGRFVLFFIDQTVGHVNYEVGGNQLGLVPPTK